MFYSRKKYTAQITSVPYLRLRVEWYLFSWVGEEELFSLTQLKGSGSFFSNPSK
jgi:hypothetical protein